MEAGSYTYLFVIGAIVAFADGFGIGSNDVANSFSTSVGSRSLTLKQACGIALITEFLGAFLLGSKTSETIRSNIIKVNLFDGNPGLLMLGMVCALFGSALWVNFASKKGWPVSTTHSIVGAIIGVGIAAFGVDTIDWGWGGVGKIIASWFISPIAAGVVASAIFLMTKYGVLTRSNSFKKGLTAVPLFFLFTAAINILYIIFKGAPALGLDKVTPVIIAPVVVGVSLAIALFSHFFYAQWLKRKIQNKEDLKWYHIFVIPCVPYSPDTPKDSPNTEKDSESKENSESLEVINDKENSDKKIVIVDTIGFFVHGVNKDVPDYKADKNKEMHDAAPKYDAETEELYSFLQVFTATFASFAHGSNDVANAVGPLSVISDIYRTGATPKEKTSVELWVLAYGGLAIDAGLFLYGYHVMRSLGNRLTYHSPSRGYSMELGTSLTVLTASKLGLPISTTHCISGATAGVGLCNGNFKAINLKFLAWCFFSWILTVPFTATVAGSIFAFVINAPKYIT